MHLTRRGIALSVGILLLGALSQWLPDGSAAAGLWRVLAAAALIALAVEAALSRGDALRAELQSASALRLGRPGTLRAEIHKDHARPARLRLLWPLPLQVTGETAVQSLDLAGHGRASLSQGVTPTRLGRLAIEPLRVRREGRLGLAWWSRTIELAGPTAQVQPDQLGLAATRAGGQLQGERAPQRRGGGLELLGLRDYQPGDPLRLIAWKSAAKSGVLQVREFSQDQHLDLLLVVDCGRAGLQQLGALTRLHHAVNVGARLAERAAALGDRVGVLAYAGDRLVETPLASGVAGVRRVRRTLARLAARAEESDPLAAALHVARLCRVRALVVWFSEVDSAGDGPLPLAMRRLLPRHLPLLVGFEDEGVAALAEQPPREWLDPYRRLAAQQLIERATRSHRALARLGCEVVSAPPQTMDAALVARYLELRGRGRV